MHFHIFPWIFRSWQLWTYKSVVVQSPKLFINSCSSCSRLSTCSTCSRWSEKTWILADKRQTYSARRSVMRKKKQNKLSIQICLKAILLTRAPPRKAILPGVRPIRVATVWMSSEPKYVRQSPVNQAPINQSRVSITGQPGTWQYITGKSGTGQPVNGHQSQVIQSGVIQWLPGTGHLITSHRSTSHRAPVNLPGTGHNTAFDWQWTPGSHSITQGFWTVILEWASEPNCFKESFITSRARLSQMSDPSSIIDPPSNTWQSTDRHTSQTRQVGEIILKQNTEQRRVD